ncbi:uncharacterized protein LOC131281859 [Anopheles ziemanni]|uniref:uncharacterized protein LOC131265535 n=1 Tax=Anopheles coustani TaxID=139045 RepID=UPI002659DA81|nr:uncharacterized protein LOC131265535 [Anopheles coustani]XP_058167199.1 uncharacterized protein LOC131281859 [Anopheles ziemanni]
MDKPSRPVRNRKRSRKAWPPGDTHRPVKRLFTPEIKRMLKDWLVRRRENPYPNREEKKLLAHETGLTYTQICNWFANWRRKLKNSGNDPPTRKTWGNLIKNYNTNARGNVEQFSICSSDSIWGEHGVGGEDSRDSLSPDSSGDEVSGRLRPQQGPPVGGGYGGQVTYLNYAPRGGVGGTGTPYEVYGSATGAGHSIIVNNNNNETCHNNNLIERKYVDYVRLSEFERFNERTENGGGSSPREDVRETYPAATFCFDHCYTPRNYETVFGIPEETRCYKVTQIDGKYVPENGTTLEPLILTTAATYTHPYGKEVQTNGTLYLTPTTTLSPAVGPLVSAVPNARSSRSSKYKNSIMEKYLRDLGELEAAKQERPTVVPVLMAAIPLQQAHYHHHHPPEYDQQKHPPPIQVGCEGSVLRGPPSLSKWLESTAKFTPSKHNYIDWDSSGKQSANKKRCDSGGTYFGISGGPPDSTREDSPPTTSYGEMAETVPPSHQKDEIDAAEALTRLANNFRTKFST